MNARAMPLIRAGSVLRPEFASLGERELASHLREAGRGRFFPVVEADATRPERIDALVDGRFEFNHETHELPIPPNWLDNPSGDIEWHILLHKFYYAVGLGMAYERRADPRYLDCWVRLTDSWIEQVEPGYIASDVTGRRIQNWIYAYHFFVLQCDAPLPAGFLGRFLTSLEQQVEYLQDHLAPSRNHRTLELYAIFLASVAFPELARAGHWQQFSFRELIRNLHSDLLPDGVHVELSTDYHHIVLRNFLCVRRLACMNGIGFPAASDRLLERALEFSMHVHRPDGVVPALSDGDARSYLDLLQQGAEIYGRDDFLFVASAGARGRAPDDRCRAFHDAGYYVQRSGWGGNEAFADARHLVLDCGPVGAGNHGHFDLLSFEASAYGRSLVVDPGRYTYDESGPTNWRVLFRGTGYHNTVQIDGSNQTRYRPGPRKYRIAGPHALHSLVRQASGAGCDILHGRARSHEYDALHERCIFFVDGSYWYIADRIGAGAAHTCDQLFHLAPGALGMTSQKTEANATVVDAPGLLLVECAPGAPDASVETGYVSASYGQKSEAPIVRFRRKGATVRFDTLLVPYRDRAPRISAAPLPVTAPGGDDAAGYASALRISRWVAGECIRDLLFLRHGPTRGAVRFGGVVYDGDYLALRLSADGRPAILHADPGANLAFDAPARLAEPGA